MDKRPHTDAARAPEAAVVWANRYAFRPGERLAHTRVPSRMLLWRLQGNGQVRVNGTAIELGFGQMAWLPWGRRMAYRAAETDPMQLAAVHVVPAYAADRQLAFGLGDEAPASDHAARRDIELAGLEGVVQMHVGHQSPLRRLAEIIVDTFAAGRCTPAQARLYGPLLIETLAEAREAEPDSSPPALREVIDFLRRRLDEPIQLDDVAAAADCSTSTVNRRFREAFGLPTMQWLNRERMRYAAELLRSTRLPVHQVALQVGVPDPFYFSRCFRRYSGLPPRDYRRRFATL
jgi:AraC-like DNA-binding protein/quercetin dioxygenase-like cupin family protein